MLPFVWNHTCFGLHMPDHLATTLNSLVETAKDGQQGFGAAADDCSSPDLKKLFRELSAERGTFATQLQALVTAAGTAPEESGSLAGAVHRGWINLKSSLATREDLAVLEECERGEDSAVNRYHDALQTNHLGATASTVQRQYDRIVQAHHQVRDLRDKLSASTLPN
ncbi:MAG: PA2169 family four-helix-bundle protein [Bryobacteraceae bacterium]|nr:PA2169 family four-helix-bundle protein [Bryobacteraceae bacterium]